MLPEKLVLAHIKNDDHHTNRDSATKKKVPDLFIYLQDHLFSVARSTLACCELINNEVVSKQKIIFITEPLDVGVFQKIMDLLKGTELEISTMKQLAASLNILDYLQARIYIDQIERQIEQDIQSYDIFCLLQLAYTYGMQRIFDLCLRYLEFDQFQQIKYNKFDFLQCDFKLFQIVLRRHHILKMRGEIQGLQVSDVEDVIRTFCYRKQFDEETLHRLLQKYVQNLQKFQRVKTSLRLDKLAHKNILQSANIDTDFYEEGIQQLKGLIQNSLKKSGVRKRKYSIELKQKLKDIKLNEVQMMPNAESIFQDQNQGGPDVYSIKVRSAGKKYQVPIECQPQDPEIQMEMQIQMKEMRAGGETEPELVVSKISGLLNEYEQALAQHDQKYKNIKRSSRNTRSLLFHNIGNHNDILSKAKLLNSSNLKNQNLLFTIYEPNM